MVNFNMSSLFRSLKSLILLTGINVLAEPLSGEKEETLSPETVPSIDWIGLLLLHQVCQVTR